MSKSYITEKACMNQHWHVNLGLHDCSAAWINRPKPSMLRVMAKD